MAEQLCIYCYSSPRVRHVTKDGHVYTQYCATCAKRWVSWSILKTSTNIKRKRKCKYATSQRKNRSPKPTSPRMGVDPQSAPRAGGVNKGNVT